MHKPQHANSKILKKDGNSNNLKFMKVSTQNKKLPHLLITNPI